MLETVRNKQTKQTQTCPSPAKKKTNPKSMPKITQKLFKWRWLCLRTLGTVSQTFWVPIQYCILWSIMFPGGFSGEAGIWRSRSVLSSGKRIWKLLAGFCVVTLLADIARVDITWKMWGPAHKNNNNNNNNLIEGATSIVTAAFPEGSSFPWG